MLLELHPDAQQQNYNYMKIWHPSDVVANITGGMIIGQSVTGGVPNSVLTIDGAGNLSQSTPVTANTILSWSGASFAWVDKNNFTLTEYADNAAAIVGGLVVGDLYYTNVAGDGIVKIVI